MTTHIDILAGAIVAEGVTHAFGVLGSGASFALMEALAREGVPYQPVAHEAEAGLMAGACCRGGETRAVAITIKGPGFANLVPAMVANAYENRPAVTVSEAYAPDASAAAQHKRLDHGGIAASVVKGRVFAGAEMAPVEQAFGLARREAPGPVHIELCAQPVEAALRPTAEAADETAGSVDAALLRIASARRPALVLGSAVVRQAPAVDWTAAGVPVATTAAAKGAIDEHHPLAAGVLTGERGELSPESAVLAHADLIVGIGLRNREMVRSAPFESPLVLIDSIGGDQHEGFDAVDVAVVADLEQTCTLVLDALGAAGQWGEDLTTARFARIEERLTRGWLPSHVFGSVSRHAPHAVVVLDTGLFCIVGESSWRARSPELFCGSSNGRFMGTGIPTGVGIALCEERPVVAVVGDGGARPYFGSLAIAAERGLPLLTVVMDDGGFGTIASGDPVRRVGHPALSSDAPFAAMADAFGIERVTAQREEDADAAVRAWAADPRPLLLHARFDPRQYVSMVEGLR